MTTIYQDVDPSTVVVACFPNGSLDPKRIWVRRFMGVKVGENHDGTIKVLVSGVVDDFRQAVFRK